jgi:hypothetical protein
MRGREYSSIDCSTLPVQLPAILACDVLRFLVAVAARAVTFDAAERRRRPRMARPAVSRVDAGVACTRIESPSLMRRAAPLFEPLGVLELSKLGLCRQPNSVYT